MDVITFRIEEIKTETPECFTFYIKEVNGKQIDYKAGQFLTLLLRISGKEVRRSYSLSSSPNVDKRLSFTVKRLTNGEASRYLTDVVRKGDLLEALQPAGRFTIENYDDELYCFIAAGSGITPVFSLIKQLLNYNAPRNIVLIYQSRNEASTVFRKDLLLLQEGYKDRFTLIELFSQPAHQHTAPRRLNNTLFEQLIKEHVATDAVQFYICGPALFMHMAQFTLKTLGYSSARIKKENFTISPPAPPLFMIDPSPRNVSIYHREKQYQYKVAYPESILQAALKHQIHLPYSCRGGRCSTCTVRLLSGNVKMTINDVLTPEDIKAGLVLTCVGYAESDVILRVE